jgi:hypothetical protein
MGSTLTASGECRACKGLCCGGLHARIGRQQLWGAPARMGAAQALKVHASVHPHACRARAGPPVIVWENCTWGPRGQGEADAACGIRCKVPQGSHDLCRGAVDREEIH